LFGDGFGVFFLDRALPEQRAEKTKITGNLLVRVVRILFIFDCIYSKNKHTSVFIQLLYATLKRHCKHDRMV